MKFKVTAQAFKRGTSKRVGKSRTETINTKTNMLFKNANTLDSVRKHYESFWNDLNPRSSEIVIVSKVVKVK